jgi:general L-amino acid transport system substrate-binding protein
MIYPMLFPSDKALPPLNTGQQTLEFLRSLLVAGQKICVAEQTSTIDTLHKLFTDRPQQIIGKSNNEQVALTYNAGRECQIMASDESQLLAYRQVYPNIKEHLIIPIEEMIAFEPLAPFVAQGDSEWRNVVNYTIWAIMVAEQLGITQDIAIRIAGLPDVDAINQELMKLVTVHQAFSLPQYKEFLGIEKMQAPITANFAIPHDFALRVIVQVGNYGEIFGRNLGKNFPRGINCIWEPLKPLEAPNGCRLIIPPP